MNWYLAKIVFRILGEDEKYAQYDEQLRLIEAEEETGAFEKAKILGENEDHTFVNTQNKIIHWKFLNVTELQKLAYFSNGMEVYSITKTTKNPEQYQTFLAKKEYNIEMKTLALNPQK